MGVGKRENRIHTCMGGALDQGGREKSFAYIMVVIPISLLFFLSVCRSNSRSSSSVYAEMGERERIARHQQQESMNVLHVMTMIMIMHTYMDVCGKQ